MVMTSFAACNNTSESSSGGNTTSAPEGKSTTAAGGETTSAPDSGMDKTPVTLKVWESLDGPDEFIKQAGEKFTAKYPWITIEFVNVELGDSTSQIALDGPAGVGPDLFAAPHDKLGELVSGGHVLPTANADTVKGLGGTYPRRKGGKALRLYG